MAEEKEIPRGVIGEFLPNKDEWIYYQERLEICFDTYGVTAEEKKKGYLLNAIGAENYKLVRDLATPNAPKNKTYDELCSLLKSYYAQPIVIFKERRTFYDLRKTSGESAVEYMARIKRAASNCEFGNKLEEIVLDKLVTSMSGKVFEKLCDEDVKILTLKRAMDIAIKGEAQTHGAEVNAIDHRSIFKKFEQNRSNVYNKNIGETTEERVSRCKHCGYKNHISEKCKFRTARCNNCGRMGHISTVCKNKKINCLEDQYIRSADAEEQGDCKIMEIKKQVDELSKEIAKLNSDSSKRDFLSKNNSADSSLGKVNNCKEMLENILTVGTPNTVNGLFINVIINKKNSNFC